jgi:hypothetical protein
MFLRLLAEVVCQRPVQQPLSENYRPEIERIQIARYSIP